MDKTLMSKQDILVRMSIDPQWSPGHSSGLFYDAVKRIGDGELMTVNVAALHAERRGRWNQIRDQLVPVYSRTIAALAQETDFVDHPIFQRYLSSEYLWNVDYSLPHPAGYGRGIEKATSFLNHLRDEREVPSWILELAQLEYAKFRAAYIPPSVVPSEIVFGAQIYLSECVSLLNAQHDVLEIIEGKSNTPRLRECFYVVAPKGKCLRVRPVVFQILAQFQNGVCLGVGLYDENLLSQCLKYGLISHEPQNFQLDNVKRLVKG